MTNCSLCLALNHNAKTEILSVPDQVQIVWIGKTGAAIKWRRSLFPEQELRISEYIIVLSQGSRSNEYRPIDPVGSSSKYEHVFQHLQPCTVYSFQIVPVDDTGRRLNPVIAKFQTKGGQATEHLNYILLLYR